MAPPIVRLMAWLLATLPVLLGFGGVLRYADLRLVGLCIGLVLETLVAILAVKGRPRSTMSLGVCLCVALIGWASLVLFLVTCPVVGGQSLLPLKLIAAALTELFCK